MQLVEIYINGSYVDSTTVNNALEHLVRDEITIPEELRGGLVEVKSSGELIDSYYA